MFSAKKLVELAYKSQRRFSFPKPETNEGCFVIYTADNKRFEVPLIYLNNFVFQELLKMSEHEYGLPRDGPITLPYEAVFMEYVICLVKRGVANKEMESVVLNLITTSCSSLSSNNHQENYLNQQSLV
ncbi:hypothetical protein ACFE04_022008 [Oxalis oulophora]